eukprot:7068872-Prymnesium_polylepis.1
MHRADLPHATGWRHTPARLERLERAESKTERERGLRGRHKLAMRPLVRDRCGWRVTSANPSTTYDVTIQSCSTIACAASA